MKSDACQMSGQEWACAGISLELFTVMKYCPVFGYLEITVNNLHALEASPWHSITSLPKMANTVCLNQNRISPLSNAIFTYHATFHFPYLLSVIFTRVYLRLINFRWICMASTIIQWLKHLQSNAHPISHIHYQKCNETRFSF